MIAIGSKYFGNFFYLLPTSYLTSEFRAPLVTEVECYFPLPVVVPVMKVGRGGKVGAENVYIGKV